MIDDKIKAVMNGLSYFATILYLCEIAHSNKQLKDSDIMKAEILCFSDDMLMKTRLPCCFLAS